MNEIRTERPTAVTVGVLYILATAAGGVAAAVASAPVSVDELAADQATTLVGALALAVMAVACMGVAAADHRRPQLPGLDPALPPDGGAGDGPGHLADRLGLRPTTADTLTLERSSSWMPTPVS